MDLPYKEWERIVPMTRFPQPSEEMITRLMHVLSYVHDVETLEMLLQLGAQVDSYATFEQKVLVTAAKSALQVPIKEEPS